ncbi:MAG: hypothetical protein OXE52_10420 [Chloroflexi bacterium]|nr:hypothetical protein [Chloroflexota bacterium]
MPMQGGGGGKPEKPESENVWKFPWLIPQPPPEPIPDRPPAPIEPPSPPEPEPVTGPPAFDTGPSPYLTPEVTSYARPPSSKEEADRRKKRIERARKRWENAKQRARTAPTPPVIDKIPDIEEVQDDYDPERLVDDVGSDRLYAYSNLEFLRVRQDMENRPLTFRRCFEQAESPRMALEFIYAEPPDCSDGELAELQRESERQSELRLGMGGDSEGTTGADSIGIGSKYGILQEYEESLESKYGFQIEWARGSYDTNRLRQLQNLDKSIAHIVNYLAKEVYDDEHAALKTFKEHFGQSKFGQLMIYLGAESDPEDKGYGSVPLPYYDKEGKLINADVEELKKMYLGSGVDIPTIVHEFGHVVDRSRGFTDHLTDIIPPYWMSRIATVSREYGQDYGDRSWGYYSFNLDATVYSDIIEGFVAKQFFEQELWADLFMTAVLDPAVSGETFIVQSIRDEDINIFKVFDDPDVLFKCGIDAPCIDRVVEWKDTDEAEAAQWYLPIVFRELLSG